MDLAQWHDRLSRHFSQLQTARQGTSGHRPLFALEHGLDQSELLALQKAVRANVAFGPQAEHALPWIVYAAEVGYKYSGDEYWQTFEEDTPAWATFGNRNSIRYWFRWFHTKFAGAKPSGIWANHFSIICWPITHAILPRDLQQQLARILYEIRQSFSANLFESPATLGELIAARSWNASSRFQNLAQETLLVGQIAAALLLQGKFGTETLIHPATLLRIGNDLDRERRGREWLRDARRTAQERARIQGLTPGGGTRPGIPRRPEEARAEVAALGIEPRLVLRPTDASASQWEVRLEIPDLSHLLVKFPSVRDILTGARCIVAGAIGRPLARGRCLYGPQRVALAQWPRADEVLLKFERSDEQLDFLLRTECLLRPGPNWLFRIASDGLAYESRSLGVRTGERYIFVSAAGPVKSDARTQRIALTCRGAHAVLLDLPDALTPDWENTLRNLGLNQARKIEVWPAGLAAAVWDGEGHGEWLSSERPCLAIRSDHPIDALLISMTADAEGPLTLESIAPGVPTFVELPQLPVGLHTVRVSARQTPGGETELLGDLDVVMRIREAQPWSVGVSPHGPLSFQIEPAVPTLEELWEGRVELSIHGPARRFLKCRVSLFERNGEAPVVARGLPPMLLPLGAEGWRTHFEKHFREERDAQKAYDTARVCEIEFSAEELGAFKIRSEREFTPLRWALRKQGQAYLLRLLEDVGSDAELAVTRLSFENPSQEEVLSRQLEYEISAAGGLYAARLGEFTAAIVVPPMIRDFSDFGCVPRIDRLDRSTDGIIQLIRLARLWSTARLPGNFFSVSRQRKVLQAITFHVFRVMGGDTWANAELTARDSDKQFARLRHAVFKQHEEAVIGRALLTNCADLATASHETRIKHMATIVVRYFALRSRTSAGSSRGADDPAWLSELALRLASNPAGVEVWAGQQLRSGIANLLELPTLARAARFLVVATDHQLQSCTAPGELYAGWGWA